MKAKHFTIFLCLLFAVGYAQVDSISYKIQYDAKSPILKVEQTMSLHRATTDSVYYFYAWANAYKDRTTTLSKVKLIQRNDDLYFANLQDRGWLENIHFSYVSKNGKRKNLPFLHTQNELIQVFVPKTKNLQIQVRYNIHLPSKKITGYGRSEDGSLLLKYFFIQPEVRENNQLLIQNFKDFESLTAKISNYTVNLDVPKDFEIHTDLQRYNIHQYVGKQRDFFQIAIQKKGTSTTIKTPYGTVIFDRTFPEEDNVLIQKTINSQLKFLTNRFGEISEPLYISGKSYRKNKFQGVQDVDIPIIHKTYQIFYPEDRIKLEMISQLTDAYLDRKVLVNMQTDHWLRHGLSHYLLLEYLDQELPDLILAGKIPEDVRIGNFKPLKYLDASRVKIKERSKWLYSILLQSNFAQPINTPYEELSNYNQKMISEVRAGLSFQYLATYLGEDEFNSILKSWMKENASTMSVENFKNYLKAHTDKAVDWFFDDMISHKGWYDIGIQKVENKNDSVIINFRNKGNSHVPFKLNAYANEEMYSTWIQDSATTFDVALENKNYQKFVINDSIKLPDFSLKNDLYKSKGLLSKPLKLGWITDIPSREFTQVFLLPGISWNNYDKLQLGLSIGNRTPLPQTWVYKIKPLYAFGENDLTGNFDLRRNIYPRNNFFRRISIDVGGKYKHYNRGMAYKRMNVGLEALFRKPARSTRNRTIFTYYQLIDREVRPTAPEDEKELRQYGLLNMGYNYWNTNIIHERRGLVNLQVSNSFSKLSGEYYYRWKFDKQKIIGVRVFAGAFISHDLNHAEYFDFGLDRISDYTFSYPLLGRSETQGILSQQFVLVEGGFKSNFYKKSNQLLFTTNWELPVWKMIDMYIDLGYLKDKDAQGEFLYDSGFRLRFIPDFLELYFPIQSSLGFEPTLGAYHERIRFMLNLDLKKFMDYWRRGKY